MNECLLTLMVNLKKKTVDLKFLNENFEFFIISPKSCWSLWTNCNASGATTRFYPLSVRLLHLRLRWLLLLDILTSSETFFASASFAVDESTVDKLFYCQSGVSSNCKGDMNLLHAPRLWTSATIELRKFNDYFQSDLIAIFDCNILSQLWLQ